MEPQIRLIRAGELPALLELYRHLHPEDTPPIIDGRLRTQWSDMLRNPMLRYVVADAGGALVSTCHLAIVPNLTRSARPYGWIENVVTHPDWRRKGLGTRVLRFALALAWEAGCYKVMLLTSRAQTHAFYESAGFTHRTKAAFVALPPGT